MPVRSETGLANLEVSQNLIDDPSDGARTALGTALSASASSATQAPALTRTLPAVSVDTLTTLRIAREPTEPPLKIVKRDEQWQRFENMGLGARAVSKAQKLVVSTYRLVGFGILTLVVFVLLGYIAVTAFYFFNRTWVAPIVISASDENVVALQSQLAAQENQRANLVGELQQAERAIAAEQLFHLQFVKAIKKDLAGRRIALDRAKQLSQAAATTREEIRTTNADYSQSTVARMGDDFAAGMIDRDAMLAGKVQLAQISTANLSLAERQNEFDERAAELAVQTQSLDAILANKSATAALSYDVLRIARDYEASKLALARELGNRDRLKASIERQDQIIAGLNRSSYLRAIADHATVALVPYANLGNVKKGTPLYGCRLKMMICRQVGTVLEVLPGEVQVRHPSRDMIVRGRMVEMQLSEPDAAQDMVLFAGGAPLGI